MKIYFAGSIRGGREDAAWYAELIEMLGAQGTVLTEHFGEKGITAAAGTGADVAAIYAQDMAWVTEADVIVAEVTTPSLGVGYEIGRAEEMGKPILGLYRPKVGKSLSAMIAGNPAMVTKEYTTQEEARAAVVEFFSSLPHTA